MGYKGKLKGFPEAVVNSMLDCQEEQGNKRDVSVFEERICASVYYFGFCWEDTKEGFHIWNDVLIGRNFERFTEVQKEISTNNIFKTVVDYFDSNELIAENDDYNIEILGYVIPVSIMRFALDNDIAHSTVTEWLDFQERTLEEVNLVEYSECMKEFVKHSALTTDAEKAHFVEFILKTLC